MQNKIQKFKQTYNSFIDFEQLFNMNYRKGASNEELMNYHNFVEICDCGQSIYIYVKG